MKNQKMPPSADAFTPRRSSRRPVPRATFQDFEEALSDVRCSPDEAKRNAQACLLRACEADWNVACAALSVLFGGGHLTSDETAEALKTLETARLGLTASDRMKHETAKAVKAHVDDLLALLGSVLRDIFDGKLVGDEKDDDGGDDDGAMDDVDDDDDHDDADEPDDSFVVSDGVVEYVDGRRPDSESADPFDDSKSEVPVCEDVPAAKRPKVCAPASAAPTYGLQYNAFGSRGAMAFNSTMERLFYEAQAACGGGTADQIFQQLGGVPGLELADVHARLHADASGTEATDYALVKEDSNLVALTEEAGWLSGTVDKVSSDGMCARLVAGDIDMWVPLCDPTKPWYTPI